ncbi:hypothetical protein HMPREF0063_11912 [Aeromicrobium marinum DSM 15272]|uniref:Uncharacterized protein n=1 Tax=Aeromicrobium marinum DSM 15272 TaxID=585531 RepID=E2SDX6_9ACTN|nr:hypothetical protein [Aeromicrobium marinum]EFQ82703.1 hypothetical protein HMPREF0063_11912 [Aeromicrobium marinum DSM 15272]
MAFVDAYDTKTGKKLPYLVPEHHIDHPVLGKRIARIPSKNKTVTEPAQPAEGAQITEPKRPGRGTSRTTNTDTPAAGDKE